MRLLITTQAVDSNDPVLGFFHRWIQELAKHCEQVHIVCLTEGIHELPHNVTVHSLGKSAQGRPASGWEKSRARMRYIMRFFRLIYMLRREYDTVFVHMNAEYVVLGGLLWRMWGNRIVLWRNHKVAGCSTWLAAHMAQTVCYTSDSAYVARFKNAVKMPLGIDVALFTPGTAPAPANSILFLGRLDEIKHPDIFLRAIERLSEKGLATSVRVVGDPTPGREAYANDLKYRFQHVRGVSFQEAIPNTQAPEVFRAHAIYVNLTPSGSFDKTIGEAAASGCIIVAANDALRGVAPATLLVDPTSADSVAQGIETALKLSADERAVISQGLRAYIIREHSLTLLTRRLVPLFSS